MDTRRTLASVFDDAGIFKLGSARFRTNRITGTTTDEGEFFVDLVCIEAGRAPSLPYGYDEVSDTAADYKSQPEYTNSQKIVNNLLQEDGRDNVRSVIEGGAFGQSAVSLPAEQRFSVNTAEDLLRSGQIWTLASQTTGNYSRFAPHGITTQYYTFKRNLTEAEKSALIQYTNAQSLATVGSDDLFYLKAIARVEEASYTTVSPCNIADIALKAQVYRRISGRQQTYGSERRAGYAISDNGTQQRVSMFLLHYRIAGGAWSMHKSSIQTMSRDLEPRASSLPFSRPTPLRTCIGLGSVWAAAEYVAPTPTPTCETNLACCLSVRTSPWRTSIRAKPSLRLLRGKMSTAIRRRAFISTKHYLRGNACLA